MNPKPVSRFLAPALVVIGAVSAVVFTMLFPEVEGLGGRVRLPVFHGALTWVNLAGFALLAVVALFFVARRAPRLYAWVEALRWTGIAVWLVGSGLGLLAAFKTWDFTGSQSSPVEVAMQDPRMIAQFWIVLLGLAVIALALVIENKMWLAIADVAFVAVAWGVLLRAILGPGRALHPDSPVLNSEEIFIKLMFAGIVAGLAIMYLGLVRWIALARAKSSADPEDILTQAA